MKRGNDVHEWIGVIATILGQILTWWAIYWLADHAWHAKDTTTVVKYGLAVVVIVILYSAVSIIQALTEHKEQTVQAINRAGRKW